MKILVDEHIPLMTVQVLPTMGYDVRDIRGTPDEGMQDDALWEMAQREERLLITTDSWSREIETFDRGCIAYGGDLWLYRSTLAEGIEGLRTSVWRR